jgi:predicted MFS family arabinose efflux permease
MMIYNKITLAFPEKEEKLFLKNYFFDSLNQFRVSFVLVTIIYGIFGYLDTLMFPEFAKIFHIIRYVFVIPILLVVFLLSFTKVFQKIWQELLLISFIIGGSGISIMTMLVPENYAYYAGMMLIFSAGYCPPHYTHQHQFLFYQC